MELLGVLLVAATVFLVCFLIDKGFTRLFRSQSVHHSGLAVRLNRKYGAFGLILVALGVATVFSGMDMHQIVAVCGVLVILVGIGLTVYYMSFGVFYDDKGFLVTTFGKHSTSYRYADIQAQQLYNSYGSVIIELHLTDGRTVQLQSGMTGVYSFLDKAFAMWCTERGICKEDCPFHNPSNSCWFPPVEEI